MRRAAAIALVATGLGLAAGCGEQTQTQTIAPGRVTLALEEVRVGRGPTGGVVLRPAVGPLRLPVVVFLHGIYAIEPSYYRPWLEHLARQGNVVIYPSYQGVVSLPGTYLSNVRTAVAAALERVPADASTLVIAGHSAGGALAADYAATAASAGLPVPRAVFAAYPGRRLANLPLGIPAPDLRGIGPGTRIVVLAGADDLVVGTLEADRIVNGAVRVPRARRSYTIVGDPAVDDHVAPQRADAAARAEFWARLDRLLAETRGSAR